MIKEGKGFGGKGAGVNMPYYGLYNYYPGPKGSGFQAIVSAVVVSVIRLKNAQPRGLGKVGREPKEIRSRVWRWNLKGKVRLDPRSIVLR